METSLWNHNGKQYARVSQVIASLKDFGSIPPDLLARKAAIGTETHRAIDAFLKEEFTPPSLPAQGYFCSACAWLKALDPKISVTEKRYFDNDLMLTGCLDAIVSFNEGLPVVCDWKTSAQECPLTWPIQGHLYHYLAMKAGMKLDPRVLFIKLDKTGKLPMVYCYEITDETMERSLSLVDAFWLNHS